MLRPLPASCCGIRSPSTSRTVPAAMPEDDAVRALPLAEVVAVEVQEHLEVGVAHRAEGRWRSPGCWASSAVAGLRLSFGETLSEPGDRDAPGAGDLAVGLVPAAARGARRGRAWARRTGGARRGRRRRRGAWRAGASTSRAGRSSRRSRRRPRVADLQVGGVHRPAEGSPPRRRLRAGADAGGRLRGVVLDELRPDTDGGENPDVPDGVARVRRHLDDVAGQQIAGAREAVPCWRPIAWLLMLVIPELMGVIGGRPAAVSASSAAVSASKTKPEQSTPRPTRCMNARRVSAVGGHVALSRPRSTARCIAACSCSAVPLPTRTALGSALNQARTPAPSSACEPPAAPRRPRSG